MMQDLGWTTAAMGSLPVDWREIDLVAERIGALPDAPLPMPLQSLDMRVVDSRHTFWLRVRSAFTARAGL